MLSVPFIITLLAAGGMCVPLYSAPEASAGTMSSIEKRHGTRWYCSDRTDPSTCTISTWTDGQGDGQRSRGGQRPKAQEETTPEDSSVSTGNIENTQTDDSSVSTGNTENTQTDDSSVSTNNDDTTSTDDSSVSTGKNQTTPTDNNSMLATINKWRTAYGKGDLTWAQDLVAGAAKTGTDNNGKGGDTFQHGGSGNAEVMTPGGTTAGGQDLKGYSPFEVSYILGWLCEVPTGPVASACADLKSVMNMSVVTIPPASVSSLMHIANMCDIRYYGGNTGHHDILVDNRYKRIGCAFTKDAAAEEGFVQGLWICNLS
ncbi:MAG: hypothetical protein L6R42_005483 [Xanthoria sp. 1 TBL-2021]|nr:MAG: hypothetical protein L6R42_005483 [Xanthoria sp. 1 TBL-2021]